MRTSRSDHRPATRRRAVHGRTIAVMIPLVAIAGTLLTIGADRVLNPPQPAVGVEAGAEPGPAATALDTELARRFALAQQAAAADGVPLEITSGWRSAQDQQAIVDKALARYGDPVEAHRWVLPPELSAHVQGLAIDVGGTEGASWLTDHGLEFGLCRTYANEVWHFEKLPDGATDCPEPHADSSWGW